MSKQSEGAAQENRVVYIQYRDTEITTKELIYRAKAAFDREHHQALINELTLYVKPEERAVYYVVNDCLTGKFDF